jgi:hypothetical protein
MSGDPKIWIIDDGELAEIRSLLQDAALAFGEGEPRPGCRVQLLVTSARRTLIDNEKQPAADTHLVVFEDASRGLRKVLERSGCDLVMPLPLNMHAFRLLLSYALYEGPEKRRSRRVMLSSPLKIKRGLLWNNATLISLSLRGCGLITDTQLRMGREQELKLPGTLTQRGEVRLNGRVLSSRPAAEGGFETAMAFRLLDPQDRRTLSGILDDHGGGAALLPRTAPLDSEPAIALNPNGEPGAGEAGGEDVGTDDRRDAVRKSFNRRVLAAGSGTSHVLIGRDLSSGGMRVRPDPDLEMGDVLKLAVHGNPGQPAIMVKARVMRDDGKDGVVLRFEELPASIARRLEEMVAKLPSLPQGKRASADGPLNVVSEILGRD